MSTDDDTRRAAKRAYNRAYYAANRERAKAAARKHHQEVRLTDPDGVRRGQRERSARYRSKHPDRVSATNSATYAKRKVAVRIGDRDIAWRSLGMRDGWVCHICRRRVREQAGTHRRPLGATVDHLVPLSDRGEHSWDNVSLAHWICNVTRRNGGIAQLRLIG